MIIKGYSVSVRCTKYIWTLEVVSYRFYNHYTFLLYRDGLQFTQLKPTARRTTNIT